jgi:hypothetical protein
MSGEVEALVGWRIIELACCKHAAKALYQLSVTVALCSSSLVVAAILPIFVPVDCLD